MYLFIHIGCAATYEVVLCLLYPIVPLSFAGYPRHVCYEDSNMVAVPSHPILSHRPSRLHLTLASTSHSSVFLRDASNPVSMHLLFPTFSPNPSLSPRSLLQILTIPPIKLSILPELPPMPLLPDFPIAFNPPLGRRCR